ncbi:MAG: penicillin-binding protein 2 [Bacteroidota bacterium]
MNPFASRKYIIGAFIILIMLIYLVRLFFIQVMDFEYKDSAMNNSTRFVTQYPARGLIYDRNGVLMVYNEAAYDLMVIPRQVKDFDTAGLGTLLGIDHETIVSNLDKAKKTSWYKPSIFVKQISAKDYAVLQEKLYRFPGFYVQARTLRNYPEKIAGHILGYIGEVNDKITELDPYYKSGDYIGISGIERAYEKELRGKKGVKIFLVDVHNRIQGSYQGGKKDNLPEVGKNLQITIDAELQAYGEKLMVNKIGSIVAIEPSTGEILALVSSPGYDPNLLVGRIRSNNYSMLDKDSLKPLFNRAIMSSYPPGSTFKLVNALVGLQEGVITTNTVLPCNGGYRVGSFFQECHHGSSVDFTYSIQASCNAYYSQVFRRILDNRVYGSVEIGYTAWYNHVKSFGIGRKLETDFPYELKGLLPDAEYYNKKYKGWKWKSLTVVSLAIGQGELGVTPLQMANLAATIANRGFYYIPHLVKSIEGREKIDQKFLIKRYTSVDKEHFEPVIHGMELVVKAGTATSAFVEGLDICGKTGTAQNPHGANHSIFLAFAPMDNPKIAVAVYVENAGYGSTWAAPIASLIIEKYINDSISNPLKEQHIIEANLIPK